jgi:hypothetical protein
MTDTDVTFFHLPPHDNLRDYSSNPGDRNYEKETQRWIWASFVLRFLRFFRMENQFLQEKIYFFRKKNSIFARKNRVVLAIFSQEKILGQFLGLAGLTSSMCA